MNCDSYYSSLISFFLFSFIFLLYCPLHHSSNLSSSISSLFTAYLVWSLPTLAALWSFIRPLINCLHTHTHICVQRPEPAPALMKTVYEVCMCVFLQASVLPVCSRRRFLQVRSVTFSARRSNVSLAHTCVSVHLPFCARPVLMCTCYQQCPSVFAKGQSI